MNKNQRHRRMKAKRRECRLLFGVNRIYQLGPPRSGMMIQLIGERAAAMLDHLRGIGLHKLIGAGDAP